MLRAVPARLTLIWLCVFSYAFAPFAFAQGKPDTKQEVVVAAAANLSGPFQTLGPKFEAATGIHPVFSFASTAELAHQIENGAPFDVFAAADRAHVEELVHKDLVKPGSQSTYAEGVLALWVPPDSKAQVAHLKDLTSSSVRVIGVAKPVLAPYGDAAVAALQHAGIWDQVRDKIVYAENISMAKQFGSSGNADVVLTAYSLVIREHGTVIKVDPALYSPIEQSLAILAHPPHPQPAQTFVDFLCRGAGREVLREYGYKVASH